MASSLRKKLRQKSALKCGEFSKENVPLVRARARKFDVPKVIAQPRIVLPYAKATVREKVIVQVPGLLLAKAIAPLWIDLLHEKAIVYPEIGLAKANVDPLVRAIATNLAKATSRAMVTNRAIFKAQGFIPWENFPAGRTRGIAEQSDQTMRNSSIRYVAIHAGFR